jgi:phage shock protein PspC (stress-responsive transcriptional regulator)
MKKTFSISIAGTLFWIEEDAFQTLEGYLKGIKTHFSKEAECDEIVSDIESRIAEQFIECGKSIISSVEVGNMIASMGSISDFEQSGAQEEKTKATKEGEAKSGEKAEKRLFRNPDDKVVAGVASGIAAYLNMDVVWIRIIFAILAFTNGIGFLLYIILWLAMPEAKSASEHLEMTGTPVTLETISERIKDRVEEVRSDKDGILRRAIRFPFEIIRSVVRFVGRRIVPVIGGIIGFFLSFGSAVAILGISILLGYILLNFPENFTDFPVYALIPSGAFIVFIFSLFAALLIPLLFILLIGTRLLSRRMNMGGNVLLSLLVLWFAALLASGIMGASYGTKIASYIETAPEYKNVTRSIETPPFTAIEARSGARIVFEEGTTTSIIVRGHPKNLDTVSVKSEDGLLVIEPNDTHGTMCIFCDHSSPTVILKGSHPSDIRLIDGASAEAPELTSSTTLSITLKNGAHGMFSVATKMLSVKVENGSWLDISGTSTSGVLIGENIGNIRAGNLLIGNATITLRNGSYAEIGKSTSLNAVAKNGSTIRYDGNPALNKEEQDGSTIESLYKADDEF